MMSNANPKTGWVFFEKPLCPHKEKIVEIKVMSGEHCEFVDLDTARKTIRRTSVQLGVEGSGGLPERQQLPERLMLPMGTNCKTFIKLLNLLKFRDARMFSKCMYNDLFNGRHILWAITIFCNYAIMNFIKKLAVTPDRILRFIEEVGDDGDYKWIAQAQVNELFEEFMSFKRSDPKRLASISPHFKAYVFVHSEHTHILKVGQKRALPAYPLTNPAKIPVSNSFPIAVDDDGIVNAWDVE
eukprot:2311240-Prymnesium_polylepis.1